MSEEEKKAIKYLEFLSNEKCECEVCQRTKKEYKTILNLVKKQDNKIKFLLDDEKSLKEMNRNQVKIIEKQQREIEELKKPRHVHNAKTNEIKEIGKENYISKDKIREIFQFYIERDSLFNNDTHKMAVIRLKDVLQELLEEE